jgi:hypothetical protein
MKAKPVDWELVQRALDISVNPGQTPRDDALLAMIEALLRDALGENHGVWRWRVPKDFMKALG